MTTGFTAPRSRGRRSPVKPIGSTRPAPAAAEESKPSADPTPTAPEHAPAEVEAGAAATAPAAETASEPDASPVNLEPTPDSPRAQPPATEPTPEQEEPAVAPPVVAPKQDQQPSRLPRETPHTTGPATASTPLVVIREGTVSYASPAIHVLDLDAAARADNAHDVLDTITALKEAATDGPLEDLVNTLFGILRDKI